MSSVLHHLRKPDMLIPQPKLAGANGFHHPQYGSPFSGINKTREPLVHQPLKFIATLGLSARLSKSASPHLLG